MGYPELIDTFSDDIIIVEEAYREYLQKHPEIKAKIWASLCRTYTLVAVPCIDFFIKHIEDQTHIETTSSFRKKIETIVKTAMNRNDVPEELDIPNKIIKYVFLREVRHFLAHTTLTDVRKEKIMHLGLPIQVDKFNERHYEKIKTIISDIINLLGMSMISIENPQLG